MTRRHNDSSTSNTLQIIFTPLTFKVRNPLVFTVLQVQLPTDS